jgi:hypothetical protein
MDGSNKKKHEQRVGAAPFFAPWIAPASVKLARAEKKTNLGAGAKLGVDANPNRRIGRETNENGKEFRPGACYKRLR